MKAERCTCPTCESAVRLARQEGRDQGIREAASYIGDFDAQIDHPWRMEDTVLCKFNLLSKSRLRRKKRRGRR